MMSTIGLRTVSTDKVQPAQIIVVHRFVVDVRAAARVQR
jgi:hypothetical protein